MDDYLPQISISQQRHIDKVCMDFEIAYRSDCGTRLEDYLDQVENGIQFQLLIEMLKVEVDIRNERDGSAAPEDYYDRFAKLSVFEAQHQELFHSVFSRCIHSEASTEVRKSTDKKQGSQTAPESDPPVPDALFGYSVERVLGKGGFGIVYLARDEQLNRQVAIKMPNRTDCDVALFKSEAQILAELKHPGIIDVYQFGSTDEGSCFIVTQFVDGKNLRQILDEQPPSFEESARIIANIAEALQAVHEQGLVHRDVKPPNIIVDRSGNPQLVDFGLALRDGDFFYDSFQVGTPAYMSPEQARGEGHLIDGRSDIFSLGAVLFELLTRKPAFRGDTRSEIIDRVVYQNVRPPRQWNHEIPPGLDYICQKALSKSISDRFLTAMDMANQLREFLSQQSAGKEPVVPDVESNVPMVVPGLRAFDHNDAQFFLQLLEGSRRQNGLPDSVHFWKSRIETDQVSDGFRVGVLFGQSGCGKSSFVRAGLLPNLSHDITSIYVEASFDDTETRLTQQLARHIPGRDVDLPLADMLASIRRRRPGYDLKTLIVIDQFEQFLHGQTENAKRSLADALSQCDGMQTHVLLLVRDDYWGPTSNFLRSFCNVVLKLFENSLELELFTCDHAKQVLRLLGSAYQRVPNPIEDLADEQNDFLDQAIDGLAENGRVVCVRLALFAEMMKDQDWNVANLKTVGGTAGIGVLFLEETFSQQPYRRHLPAIQKVLYRFLPDEATAIRTHARSRDDLLRTSGYERRLADFQELIDLLDRRVRLITPVETDDANSDPNESPSEMNYQLTHDFLVPSISTWLNLKSQATRRGRAKRRFDELAHMWNVKPENRYLPSLKENIANHLFVPRSEWSESQRHIMRRSTRIYATRFAVALLILLAGAFYLLRTHARNLVADLLVAEPKNVPQALARLEPFAFWSTPELRSQLVKAEELANEVHTIRIALALFPHDTAQTERLRELLISETLSIDEFRLIKESIAFDSDLKDWLWSNLGDDSRDPSSRFRCACALADVVPDEYTWRSQAPFLAEQVIQQDKFWLPDFNEWLRQLRPISDVLVAEILSRYESWGKDDKQRAERICLRISENAAQITSILVHADPPNWKRYVAEVCRHNTDPRFIADLAGRVGQVYNESRTSLDLLKVCFQGNCQILDDRILALHERHKKRFKNRSQPVQTETTQLEEDLAGQSVELAWKAASAVSIRYLLVGESDTYWKQVADEGAPLIGAFLVDKIALAVPYIECKKRLMLEIDKSRRNGNAPDQNSGLLQSLMLSLGTYLDSSPTIIEAAQFKAEIVQLFTEHPDSGVHGAAEWLLKQLKMDIVAAKDNIARRSAPDDRRWYVTPHDHTMIVLHADDGHVFSVSATETTFAHFRRLFPRRAQPDPSVDPFPRNANCYLAIDYCNALSTAEGFSPCYEKLDGFWKLTGNPLKLNGYRLPTLAEWYYMAFDKGHHSWLGWKNNTSLNAFDKVNDRLMHRYAVFGRHPREKSACAASLLPNRAGMFDVFGNLREWTNTNDELFNEVQFIKGWGADDARSIAIRDENSVQQGEAVELVVAGGAFTSNHKGLLVGWYAYPKEDDARIGFRVVRSLNSK